MPVDRQGVSVEQLWSRGTDGCRCCCCPPVNIWLGVRETPWGLLAEEPILRVKCSWVNCSELVRARLGLQLSRSNMSAAPLASRFSSLQVSDIFDEQGEGVPSSVDAVGLHDASSRVHVEVDSVDLTGGGAVKQGRPLKRPFCKRCGKAGLLCICHHIKIMVNNKTVITILQHPQEKKHHLGSARIALLALQNVEIISIPEVDEQVSHRMREKVPGSKRFIAGRGGKRSLNLEAGPKKKKASSKGACDPKIQPSEFHSQPKQDLRSQNSPDPASGEGATTTLEFDAATLGAGDSPRISGEDQVFVQWNTVPPWINVKPNAGLLFPSEEALDLWPAGLDLTSTSDSVLTFQSEPGNVSIDGGKGVSSNPPSQLIVLDGTWSKAKRIFFENPWLHSLPHYQLPTLQHSRYGRLRREPKPGFLSTVESIVYALQLLEPETQDLESLLHVFDSMIEDQTRFVADNIKRDDPKRGCRKWHERG